jgi:hypothetical protein
MAKMPEKSPCALSRIALSSMLDKERFQQRKDGVIMTLGIRKLIVVSLAGGVFLLANFLWITSWLQDKGVIDWAKDIRRDYLTGTAITIIVVLLVLLVGRRSEGRRLLKRCPVCDHRLLGSAAYCSECGSKV